MYQNAAVLAAFLLLYSAVAGGVERPWVSGPIVFTGVRLIFGPDGIGVLRLTSAAKDCARSPQRPSPWFFSPTPRTPILPSSDATSGFLSGCCWSACR